MGPPAGEAGRPYLMIPLGDPPGGACRRPAPFWGQAKLGRQRTRSCHRIRQQLWRYFPQLLAVSGLGNELVHPWFVAWWEKAPTPAQGLQLPLRTLRNLLKKHRIRRLTANTLMGLLRTPALCAASGPGAAPRP